MLGDVLERLRIEKGLTQTAIAELLKVSRVTYNRYEKNERTPDNDTLIRIANYHNVSTDYLLERTSEKRVSDNITLKEDDEAYVIAAHAENDLTEEEQKKIIEYIEFIKSQRNK